MRGVVKIMVGVVAGIYVYQYVRSLTSKSN